MLRNYTKIAFRNLVKNKSFSFINIVGLASGMAVAILIGLWIYESCPLTSTISTTSALPSDAERYAQR
jgi:hypothetical protein